MANQPTGEQQLATTPPLERGQPSAPAVVPQVEGENLPTSIQSVTTAPDDTDGGLGQFLSDPRTIMATTFGLAFLNSDAQDLAGAAVEGLGAMGSAFQAQRARSQQEFENEARQAQLDQTAQGVETQRSLAEAQIAQGQRSGDVAEGQLGLQQQQFDFQKEIGLAGITNDKEKLRLAQQAQELSSLHNMTDNQTRVLIALLSADAQRDVAALGRQDTKESRALARKDRLVTALNTAYKNEQNEAFLAGRPAQPFKEWATNWAGLMDQLVPNSGYANLVKTGAIADIPDTSGAVDQPDKKDAFATFQAGGFQGSMVGRTSPEINNEMLRVGNLAGLGVATAGIGNLTFEDPNQQAAWGKATPRQKQLIVDDLRKREQTGDFVKSAKPSGDDKFVAGFFNRSGKVDTAQAATGAATDDKNNFDTIFKSVPAKSRAAMAKGRAGQILVTPFGRFKVIVPGKQVQKL